MCDHCAKVTSQKGYAGQVTCKCEHGEKRNGEPKDKDFGGCCSRKTFKPLLEAADTTGCFEKDKPIISSVISPRNNVTPLQLRSNVSDGGCCSWRQTCCDGVCCSRIGNCCSTGSGSLYQPSGRPLPTYGYGYDQPTMSSYFVGMTGATMPDRVPCTTRKEKKLPMCFGGDCQDSIERIDKPGEGELSPRQSER